jgi:MotA/TolQ/ExbB proton channel family
MTPVAQRRRTGVALLAAAAAAAYWAGWALGLIAHDRLFASLGAGLIAAVPLVLLGARDRKFDGLAAVLLGLCPTAALLVTLAFAEDLALVASGLGLWPLVLSLFAAMLALSLLPGSATRGAIARGGFVLALGLTIAIPLGAGDFADRWVLQSPVHLLITFAACLVFAAQARAALIAPPEPDEARMMSGMTQILPLLGFAGTVWGIMVSLGALPAIFATEVPSTDALQTLLGGLGTAFETTLLGLAAAVVVAVIDMLLPEPGAAK